MIKMKTTRKTAILDVVERLEKQDRIIMQIIERLIDRIESLENELADTDNSDRRTENLQNCNLWRHKPTYIITEDNGAC